MGLSVGNIAAAVGARAAARVLLRASSMWVANVATISPSGDTEDGKLHITPANLPSQFHRSIEPHRHCGDTKTCFQRWTVFLAPRSLPPNSLLRRRGRCEPYAIVCSTTAMPESGNFCLQEAHRGGCRQSEPSHGIREFAPEHEKRRRPACLRLRTAQTEAQVEAVQWTSRVILDQPLYDLLKSCSTALSRAHPARGMSRTHPC